ncbi:uncharacterized protein CELE_Y61B8A.6 [Caenorhabditis elegans]|uniref:Uncharacterized protein n=1 Tax=Caenorhabditis elegans TaxID=6239 RepID=I2HAK1_CAEEL|nr:Uncharacterized protein CELE_Y61B8A.6 [Caenorhabditis elegans]CCH63929.1 Uncharacterized protein CELE_Y61B8A.6 [Caenorhabditis elegans]|eukprot:NP_001263913.1 Uncharacterized protein CELE_Y61B8A.6 [Caenorhabditis elegans]
MIIGFSCHSSINVISLLIFSPPYRRFLSKIFRRSQRRIFVHAHSQSGS